LAYYKFSSISAKTQRAQLSLTKKYSGVNVNKNPPVYSEGIFQSPNPAGHFEKLPPHDY
jgi:hypothetical protein